MIRILHTGDLHPNNAATFAGRLAIDAGTGQNQALTDLEQSLEWVTQQAFRRQAQLALLAGDLFDSPKPHPNEIRIIRNFVRRLAAMMKVVAIPGNHDMSQNPNDNTALEAIKGIEGVFVVDRPEIIRLQTRDNDVTVCCLPYPTKSRLLTQDRMMAKSPEEVTAMINQGLRAIVTEQAADRPKTGAHLLLAHGTVSNAQVSDQPRSIEHDILLPGDLFPAFHYVALGHIHRPQAVADNAYYCGSLMRQSFGEASEPKGVNFVDFEPGKLPVVHHVENPHARTYSTLTMEDVRRTPQTLDPNVVWRYKDALTEEAERAIRPTVDALAQTTPWFQIAIERIQEARSRDAGMTAVLSAEDALARALTGLKSAEGQDLNAIVEKHRSIEQAVG